jgi:hypothetical protein
MVGRNFFLHAYGVDRCGEQSMAHSYQDSKIYNTAKIYFKKYRKI